MRAPGGAVLVLTGILMAASSGFASVAHNTGMVNGLQCDIWTWTDQSNQTRTVALKMQGSNNPGNGGYAIQMTYYRFVALNNFFTASVQRGAWEKVTVNAESGSDGGFGYFVSHERYRAFSDGSFGTIAGEIFGADDSPLGLGFSATSAIPLNTPTAGAESFTISYQHYGTASPWGYDSNGLDSPLLPLTQSTYTLYAIPVTTTWFFQSGTDFPRIDVSIDLSKIIASGATAAAAGLVSFDVRGPYGVMVFDNGADGIVNNVIWGDRTNLFSTTKLPATRSSGWSWNAPNNGARYNGLVSAVTGTPAGAYEMGLFEPAPASASALADSYAAERSYSSASYATAIAANQQSPSIDSCSPQAQQTLPSDGTWPYQSLQYSLPCPPALNFLTTPANGKKIAWGSSSYYGSTLTSVYNGYESLPINAWPSSLKLKYSVCLVLGWVQPLQIPGFKPPQADNTLTSGNAALYTTAKPTPTVPDCATTVLPAAAIKR